MTSTASTASSSCTVEKPKVATEKQQREPRLGKVLQTNFVKHLATKAKPAAPAEIPALPQNFGRNRQGEKLIRQEMQKLVELAAMAFTSQPLLSTEGHVRLRGENGKFHTGPHWSEVLIRAPDFFSIKF